MSRFIAGAVGVLLAFAAIFAVLFLGGLASAWWETRRERKAGLEPTRPAWENRRKRAAIGSRRERWRIVWQSLSHRGRQSTCWCGRGPLAEFPSWDGGVEVGCAAWEAGDGLAIHRHDLAGGYTPVRRSVA